MGKHRTLSRKVVSSKLVGDLFEPFSSDCGYSFYIRNVNFHWGTQIGVAVGMLPPKVRVRVRDPRLPNSHGEGQPWRLEFRGVGPPY